jgi:hypothetical protein
MKDAQSYNKPDRPHDHRETRCPRLGGPVHFGYCRREAGDNRPCFKVLDCWWPQFDVAAYFAKRLSPEDFATLGRRTPAAKITRLVDLIVRAQKNTGSR